ncbi:hypothetical protein KC328_g9 [Hortaea werneckii]|nr:hypothetical protein KC328_g9 [Hortaea werneckii]
MPFIVAPQVSVVIGYAILCAKAGNIEDNIGVCYFAVCVACFGLYPILPGVNAWNISNCSGPKKRAISIAYLICAGNIGGLIGSYIYIDSEAPSYPTGYGCSLAFAATGIVAAVSLEGLLMRSNKINAQMTEEEVRAKFSDEKLHQMGDRSPLYKRSFFHTQILDAIFTGCTSLQSIASHSLMTSDAPSDKMLPSPHQTHQQGVAPESHVLGVRLASEASADQWDENRRKAPKVSRACDFCKQKRVRCSGTVPCHTCQHRRIECTWNATHNRGRPATPATSSGIPATHHSTYDAYGLHSHTASVPRATRQVISHFGEGHTRSGHASTRESPDLETAEVDGQYHDRTSALTFIRRAWHRLSSSEGGDPVQRILGDAPYAQKITAEGDRPFHDDKAVTAALPPAAISPWSYGLPLARRSTGNAERRYPTPSSTRFQGCYCIRSSSRATLPESRESDLYFQTAELLASQETGRVSLQSVQARLLQVLYLLQTQRVTQAWQDDEGHTVTNPVLTT